MEYHQDEMNTVLLIIVTLVLIILILKIEAYFLARVSPSKFIGQHINIGEFDIYYEIYGQTGPTILMIHGIGASSYIWRSTSAYLSSKYRIINIDLPGFGQSTKKAELEYGLEEQSLRLISFLDRLKIKNTFVVGSSMGGALSLWLALNYPDRFKKVALVNPATNPQLVPLQSLHKYDWLGHFASPFINKTFMKLAIGNVVANKNIITEERVSHSLNNHGFGSLALRVFIKATKLLADPRMPHVFSNITQPVLLVWGEMDRMISRKYILELKETLPNVEFYTHKNAGHHLMEDQPEWLAEKLDAFFVTH